MNPMLYWVLFCILVSVLVVLVSCFVFNLILDNCLDPEELSDKIPQSEKEMYHLNRYRFDKQDVEDLTRIEGDFKSVLPKVVCTNEVTDDKVQRLLQKKQMPDVIEEDAALELDVEEELDGRAIGGKQISQSVDDLEFCNPSNIDVLKEINRIEEHAKMVEDQELNYFIGGVTDVKYYEINEKFLKLMIALCDVGCDTAELRKKKIETLEFIEGCQRKLKDKANQM